ncbi:nuclear nucleic acid-binding protein C1D-like [Clavelina lepadiformis]|uniref:nuclear nucleic acid-binding protein C1D-like n=1 Tax=Clavelina lepadiformis TaxID=159417 RepID=UPI0040417B0B
MNESDSFPNELAEACGKLASAVESAENELQLVFNKERRELVETAKPLDIAQLDLVTAYAINSFYWAYLIADGVDPKNHPLKQELNRIRTYMMKVEEAKASKNAPVIDKKAANRFLKSALFAKKKSQNLTKEES